MNCTTYDINKEVTVDVFCDESGTTYFYVYKNNELYGILLEDYEEDARENVKLLENGDDPTSWELDYYKQEKEHWTVELPTTGKIEVLEADYYDSDIMYQFNIYVNDDLCDELEPSNYGEWLELKECFDFCEKNNIDPRKVADYKYNTGSVSDFIR